MHQEWHADLLEEEASRVRLICLDESAREPIGLHGHGDLEAKRIEPRQRLDCRGRRVLVQLHSRESSTRVGREKVDAGHI